MRVEKDVSIVVAAVAVSSKIGASAPVRVCSWYLGGKSADRVVA